MNPLQSRRFARRTLLKGALAAGVALALPAARHARAAAPFEVATVAPGVSLLTGGGGNVLVLATDAGQVVVDSGTAAASDALLATLAGLPGGERVHTLFNTHWHREQIGGNEALGARGAAIVAHVKTQAHLATPYYVPDTDRYEAPLAAAGRPTVAFRDRGSLVVGARTVDYGYLIAAHTDGDIYVHFRDANVVAVGDVVSPRRDPVLDWYGGGWLGGRVDALATLLELGNDTTRYVPSYGPPVGRAAVRAEHDLMLTIFERLVELVRKGLGAETILAQGGLDGLSRTFDDPAAFLYAAHKGLWAHHNKLMPDIV